MAGSAVAISPGAGANVDTFAVTGGDHQQYVREAPATAATAPTSWTNATSASTSVIAADEGRRALILINTSASATVYLRYDGTGPTAVAGGYHDMLPPSSRTVVEKELCTLAVSFIASVADGKVNIAGFTAA
jgi:hypothetical protein